MQSSWFCNIVALFPVRRRIQYMTIMQFLFQKTLFRNGQPISLEILWFVTIHIISSRGLVAGEHQVSYPHEQVSQQRLVFPRENHQAHTRQINPAHTVESQGSAQPINSAWCLPFLSAFISAAICLLATAIVQFVFYGSQQNMK